MQYSLTDYILTITPPANETLKALGTITIGGEGNAAGATHDNVTFSRTNNVYSTDTFAAGGYVHNKNANKSGTVSFSVSQIHPGIAKLKRYCQVYGDQYVNGCTIQLSGKDVSGYQHVIATATDCVPQKIPDQVYGSSASTQTWTFLAGTITY